MKRNASSMSAKSATVVIISPKAELNLMSKRLESYKRCQRHPQRKIQRDYSEL